MSPEQAPILILSAGAGAGHNIAARGIEAALRTAAPDLPVEFHDVLQFGSRLFRRTYGGGYLDIVRHVPSLMGWLYERTDRPASARADGLRRMAQRALGAGGIAREILRRQPRLIINTHFLPAEIVAELRRAGRLACPQFIVTTDFETHRLWVNEPAERYFTATELGATYLATWGIGAERIQATGIPLRAAFAAPLTQRQARGRLGLAAEVPTVLLLSGAVGFGPAEALMSELLRLPQDVQIVSIAGRNERLRVRLDDLVRRARAENWGPAAHRAQALGYSERMHEWLRAADLAISKPGGLTVAEALACGTPLVVIDPIPGQETRNSDYLLEHGAAIKVNHPQLLRWRIGQLLSEPGRLAALRSAAQKLRRPAAAAEIARAALAFVTGPGS